MGSLLGAIIYSIFGSACVRGGEKCYAMMAERLPVREIGLTGMVMIKEKAVGHVVVSVVAIDGVGLPRLG